MTRTELLLIKLNEECLETAKRCTKALRFGLEEIQSGQPFSNDTRIMEEYFDLVAVVEMLQTEGKLPYPEVDMDARKARINKYLDYSQKLGILVAADTGEFWNG